MRLAAMVRKYHLVAWLMVVSQTDNLRHQALNLHESPLNGMKSTEKWSSWAVFSGGHVCVNYQVEGRG